MWFFILKLTLLERRSRAVCNCAARDPCSVASPDFDKLLHGIGGGQGGAGTDGAAGGGGAVETAGCCCCWGTEGTESTGGGCGAGGAEDVLWWPGGPCGDTLTELTVEMLPGLFNTVTRKTCERIILCMYDVLNIYHLAQNLVRTPSKAFVNQ